jgi:hypothetical protein
MQDLSHLAANSMTVTSQAGGNMQSSNEQAMTAPGSDPVDPLPDRTKQGNPTLQVTNKPRSVLTHGVAYSPAAVTWKEIPSA